MGDKPQIIRDMERALKAEYLGKEDSDEDRMIGGLVKFSEMLKKKTNLKAILSEAGMTIYRLFQFKEIGIGMWNPAERAYKYEFLIGHSPAAQEAHKAIKLCLEDMMGGKDKTYVEISKYTQFNFSEGLQYDPMAKEDALFNRPSMLDDKRKSTDMMLEGDYFDIYMFSSRDEMMGWIEVCNPKDGKFPSMKAIRWLELFACMLAPTIEKELGLNRPPTR